MQRQDIVKPGFGRTFIFLCLVTSLLLPGKVLAASDYLALIEDYVSKIANIYDGNWAYSYRIVDHLEDEVRVLRRDDSQTGADRLQLLQVNDAQPTAERLAAHRQDMERRQRRQARRSNDDEEELEERERFLAMLKPDSIHLIREEGHILHLGFRAMEEEQRDIFEHLEGRLIIDTELEYIRELQVQTTGPFSPFFLGRVEEGLFTLRFALQDGVPMQSEAHWQLRGRAFIVRSLDAERDISWFDFEPL